MRPSQPQKSFRNIPITDSSSMEIYEFMGPLLRQIIIQVLGARWKGRRFNEKVLKSFSFHSH